MSKITPTEKRFIKKVRSFTERTGVTLGTIGWSKDVNYSNTKKLEEFILEERGTITMNLSGRIEIFIKNYEKKLKK